MFTGLVEEVGQVLSASRAKGGMVLKIKAEKVVNDADAGDSIAVDGTCLTAEMVRPDGFDVFVSGETLSRTTLGAFASGRKVNLERAMKLSGRLGGHIVQGHVDGKAVVTEVTRLGKGSEIRFKAAKSLCRYMVEKGSVAVDGVSLTVAAMSDTEFKVAVVPHTLESTTLGSYAPGREVNVETDLLAKYVEKLCRNDSGNGVDMDLLARHGFLR